MKIKVITTFLLFCLIAGICYYISLPDYHVRNSMSFSNQGTRDTELTVIVYKYWGIDETIRKIELLLRKKCISMKLQFTAIQIQIQKQVIHKHINVKYLMKCRLISNMIV